MLSETNDSMYYLTRGQSVGLTIVVEAGLASLVAVLYVFLIILRNFAWRMRNLSRENWHVFQTPMDLLMFSLFSAELLQAIGCVMSLKWVHEGIVQVGGFCWAQGLIEQLGQTGGAITTLMSDLRPFIWLGKTATSLRVASTAILAGWLSVAALVIIGNAVNGRRGEALFISPVLDKLSLEWERCTYLILILAIARIRHIIRSYRVFNVVLPLTTTLESVLFGKQAHFSTTRALFHHESVHHSEVGSFSQESGDRDDSEPGALPSRS